MDDKEANIVGLLNMTTRIARKALPEAVPDVDMSAAEQQLREHMQEHREVQATQVEEIAKRFTAREVEEIVEWAESPFGQRVLEAIPVVSYYPFLAATNRLVATFTAHINELEARISELESERGEQ